MQIDSPESRSNTASPAGILIRSLLPLVALLLLLSTMWIGPWGFLVAAYGWWQVSRRIR
jgi:hypothetical protein